MNKTVRHAAALAFAAVLVPLAAQAETFATDTFTLLRGSVAGDFPGEYYGGALGGSFPVVLTEAQARASVLGANDDAFLSLPGVDGTASGAPFPGAYVEVGFGADFGSNTVLKIYETGDAAERAQLFIWSNNGGNVQPQVQTNASGVITVDLSAYAWALGSLGGTAWSKVGIGGLDVNGASQGFDLDAVSITAVPEPGTYASLAAGLAAMALAVRRRRAR